MSVSLGYRSNPSGSFVNVPTAQSLENAVECIDVEAAETHTQSTHVWWKPSPLELVFQFDAEYEIGEVFFWNYFEEYWDVDEIQFSFYDLSDNKVGVTTVYPRMGENADGQHANDVVAEQIIFPAVYNASKIEAILKSTNGEIDFQNFVFRASS